MEELIVKTARNAIKESIIKNLTDYGSPFNQMVKDVISNHEQDFKKLLEDEIVELLNFSDFKAALKEALHQKIAKTLTSKLGGELEKRVNELKQNPATRAKITVAIDKIIQDV